MKKHKALYITALVLALLLVGGKFVAGSIAKNAEQANVFTVSEIRNDDSTYRYVKEKCDSGFFSAESENCVNLRTARP